MRSPPAILIYGRDASLLQTRCWVLERAGFETVTALSQEEAIKKIDAGFADLVILCHTLSANECSAILGKIHSLHPHVKTLLLTSAHSECQSDGDHVLLDFGSPKVLIAAVSELLHKTPVVTHAG